MNQSDSQNNYVEIDTLETLLYQKNKQSQSDQNENFQYSNYELSNYSDSSQIQQQLDPLDLSPIYENRAAFPNNRRNLAGNGDQLEVYAQKESPIYSNTHNNPSSVSSLYSASQNLYSNLPSNSANQQAAYANLPSSIHHGALVPGSKKHMPISFDFIDLS